MKRVSWLDALRASLSQPPRRRHRRTRIAAIERCEDRTLLSVTSLFAAAEGELEISGDSGDAIVVAAAAGEVTVNGAGIGVSAADVKELEVSGDQLANLIDLSAVTIADFPNLVEVEIESAGGNDTVTGSEFDDEIIGGSGNDTIDGGVGDDSIVGGSGSDTLEGSAGNDVINGSSGADSLDGGDGDDRIKGQGGSDTLSGSAGDDSISGAAGADTIDGGAGLDVITGNAGSDSIMGGDGDDDMNGGAGSDSLHGNDGDDELSGASGDDMITGGAGADVMAGGTGVNLLETDSSADTATGGIAGSIEQELVATLTAPDGTVLGEVEFEQSPEDGDMEVELEVSLTNATPGIYDIVLGGITIGQITVSASGSGEVEFSNQPDDSDELPLPTNLPAITGGTTVSIGTLASGIFAVQADSDDDNDSDNDTDDDDSQEMELEAALTGATAATGRVKFESEVDDGVTETKFTVSVRDAAANTTLDVSVNGVVVGQITTDATGRGKLKFRSDPDDTDEQLFPTDFVALAAGDIIGVGEILSGTLIVD